METIVVKVGSRVLAKEDDGVDEKIVAHLAEQIADIMKMGTKVVLVSSGAVSVGRNVFPIKGSFRLKDEQIKYSKETLREQMFAAVGQPLLMAVYEKAFGAYGIRCAQILATRPDFVVRESYLSLRVVTRNLMEVGVIPIFNENDVLSPEKLDFSDNDQLATFVAAMLVADRLIILTTVDGVYDGLPTDPSSQIVSQIENPEEFAERVSDVGISKGGMKSKLLCADLATALGIPTYVANGRRERVLTRILAGERMGTFFPSAGNRKSTLKTWLTVAVGGDKGKVVVSTSLADILAQKRVASILTLGIERVEGEFEKGDIVQVIEEGGRVFGRGMVRMKSSVLRDCIARERGNPTGKSTIAIHYDYFVFA